MDSFTIFGDLLPELQDVIWDHTISDIPARVIELTGEIDETIQNAQGEEMSLQYGFVSKAPIPVVLQICARSRHLAKKKVVLDIRVTIPDFSIYRRRSCKPRTFNFGGSSTHLV